MTKTATNIGRHMDRISQHQSSHQSPRLTLCDDTRHPWSRRRDTNTLREVSARTTVRSGGISWN